MQFSYHNFIRLKRYCKYYIYVCISFQTKALVLVLVIAIAMVSTVMASKECKMICNDEVRVCKLEFCLSHSDKSCKKKCNKLKKDCMAICKFNKKRNVHVPYEVEEDLEEGDFEE